MHFCFRVSVSVFPLLVHLVNEVKCPNEIGTGCPAPDGYRMIQMHQLVKLLVFWGVRVNHAFGSAQHLHRLQDDFGNVFVHHCFRNFLGNQ